MQQVESTPELAAPSQAPVVESGGNSSLDDVKLGEFKKFVDIQDKLDRLNERRSSGQMTIGQRFEEGLNQHFTNELMGKFFGNMTGGATAVKKHEGITGIIMELLDTKAGYALGESIGKSAPQLIQMLGSGKVNEIIESYKKSSDPNYIANEETVEDRQKKQDQQIMSFDPNDPAQMQQFMQAVNMTDINAAKNVLIGEQERIMKARGVINNQQPKDINRQLMQQYDDPQRMPQQQVLGGSTNDPFFGQQSSQPAPNNNDFIASLNPDDPISQQQFMAARGMSGVPLDEVKRMMLKEMRSLKPASTDNEMDSKWGSHEEKPVETTIKKDDPINSILQLLQTIGTRLDKLEKEKGIEVIEEPPSHLHDSSRSDSSRADEPPHQDHSHIISPDDGGYPHPEKASTKSNLDELPYSPVINDAHPIPPENGSEYPPITVVDEIKVENVINDDLRNDDIRNSIKKTRFKIKKHDDVVM
jgi:hypothetical protein